MNTNFGTEHQRTSGTGTCFAKIATRLNSVRGTQRFTKPSQTDGKNKLSLYGSFMSFSYDPMYTSGIYNWGNMKGRHDSHKYHIPTKTNCRVVLVHNTYTV